jgi:hypothetical protein
VQSSKLNRAGVAAVSSAVGFVFVLLAHTAGHKALTAPLPQGQSSPGPAATTTVPPVTGTGNVPVGAPPPGGLASAVGQNEQYGYGVLSVKVTVSGRRIVDVSVVNLQTAEQYSQSLAQQVIPMLRHEVLSSQTTQVYAVSGATYTSEAYLYSAQSALDKLHV